MGAALVHQHYYNQILQLVQSAVPNKSTCEASVPGPFRIDPKELESWDDHRFVVMMCELLMLEVSRAGLTADQVDTSGGMGPC
jgi:hypothetical protein